MTDDRYEEMLRRMERNAYFRTLEHEAKHPKPQPKPVKVKAKPQPVKRPRTPGKYVPKGTGHGRKRTTPDNCRGCDRPLRLNSQPKSAFPDSVKHVGFGLCRTCYRHQRENINA